MLIISNIYNVLTWNLWRGPCNADTRSRSQPGIPPERRVAADAPEPQSPGPGSGPDPEPMAGLGVSVAPGRNKPRSEEHTSELQSLMRISYAVFCLKKKRQH